MILSRNLSLLIFPLSGCFRAERALRVVYRDFNSSFEELRWKDSSTALHQRNLQKLMTEIFQVKTRMATELTKDAFVFVNVPCNVRNQCEYNCSIRCTERYHMKRQLL